MQTVDPLTNPPLVLETMGIAVSVAAVEVDTMVLMLGGEEAGAEVGEGAGVPTTTTTATAIARILQETARMDRKPRRTMAARTTIPAVMAPQRMARMASTQNSIRIDQECITREEVVVVMLTVEDVRDEQDADVDIHEGEDGTETSRLTVDFSAAHSKTILQRNPGRHQRRDGLIETQ